MVIDADKNKDPEMGLENEFSAPKIERFGNPITRSIFIFLLTLILGGFALVATLTFWGVFIGLFMTIIGVILWVVGETNHSPSEPREAGVLTLGDTPILDDEDHPIIVGGVVFLFPFAPIYLDSIKVNIDNDEHEYTFKMTTEDGTPLEVKVSIIARPNLHDILDFIQAGGKMSEIWKQMDSIVFKETQALVRGHTGDDIQKTPELISDKLTKKIDELFASRSLGVKVVNVKIEAHLPEPLQEEVNRIKKEQYQRQTEREDYKTNRIAGKDLQRDLARDFIEPPTDDVGIIDSHIPRLVREKLIPNLDNCIEKIKDQRQIKEGRKHTLHVEAPEGMTTMVIGTNPFEDSKKNK